MTDSGPLAELFENLNAMRKERTFYDVSLIVGDQIVPAHKNVLIASSDYFRSLFIGPLGNNSQAEVDLTSVATDSSIVESVVDSMYTDELRIEPDNLEAILKLSSFLLLSTLREDCVVFMEDPYEMEACVSMYTCLKYYMLSVDHMLRLEKKLKPIVMSRFHDCLMFQENSLEITPHQFLHLKDIEALKHCTVPNLLKFMVDWVRLGDTKEHISVGYDILTYICVKDDTLTTDLGQAEDTKNTLTELKEKIKLGITDSDFIKKVCETIDSFMEISSVEQYKGKLRSCNVKGKILPGPVPELSHKIPESSYTMLESSPMMPESSHNMPEPSHNISTNSDVEEVFLALSRRQQCEAQGGDNNTYPGKCTIDEGKELFDMCMYVPKKKRWYLLQTFTKSKGEYDFGHFEKIFRAYQCVFARKEAPPYAFGRFNWHQIDSFICTQDKLYCVFNCCYLGICNLFNLKWEVVDFENNDLYFRYEKDGTIEKSDSCDLFVQTLVRGPNESLYVLMEENFYVHYDKMDQINETSWKIFKLTPDNELIYISNTQTISMADKWDWENEAFTCGSVIPQSKEMIIAHHNRYLHVFVADLSIETDASVTTLTPDYESHYVKVPPEFQKCSPYWLEVAILQDENQCYFVRWTNQVCVQVQVCIQI